MDTPKIPVHMKLPAGLIAAVDALAAKDLLTRTGWITRALISTCELAQEPQESPTVSERLAALEAQTNAKVAQCRAVGRT